MTPNETERFKKVTQHNDVLQRQLSDARQRIAYLEKDNKELHERLFSASFSTPPNIIGDRHEMGG